MITRIVKASHNISLEATETGTGFAVEKNFSCSELRIAKEVPFVIAGGHVRNKLAAESMVSYFRLAICSHFLLHAKTCRIILGFDRPRQLIVVNSSTVSSMNTASRLMSLSCGSFCSLCPIMEA